MTEGAILINPDTVLDPFIECYWAWRLALPGTDVEAILPDMAPELIIHLGASPLALRTGGEWTRQPRSFLVCAAKRSIQLAAEEPVEIFAIRFRPWGVRRFSDQPMASMLDREVLPGDIFGSIGDRLVDEIRAAPDCQTRVDIANTTLCKMLTGRSTQDRQIRAIGQLVAGGRTKCRDMAGALNVSERSFRRLWHDLVGIEHRKFASLMRFHRAVAMIDQGCDLAGIAATCGYADQSHMTRDIKRISGLPPAALRGRLGDEVYRALYHDRPCAPWEPET